MNAPQRNTMPAQIKRTDHAPPRKPEPQNPQRNTMRVQKRKWSGSRTQHPRLKNKLGDWETRPETRQRQDQGGHSIPAKADTLKTALRTPTVKLFREICENTGQCSTRRLRHATLHIWDQETKKLSNQPTPSSTARLLFEQAVALLNSPIVHGVFVTG